MFDSTIAIAVTDVSRMFKRYRHPRYRVMEALGLPLPKGAYDEFWALRGISLELERGDSLGLIGQNGAGKSTLLNIVCGRLQPSSGSITVRGNVQALMELGTGFHPEFSGRENILSSLAYQGVIGREARRRVDEIIDFSELADFIDQPVKTYSTGMYARLAFSTATAIVPDVLIIDEVLGAGDAYFAAKCAERMHRLTKESGATVLFVSHDIQAVQRLCERAIWIDHGEIRMAGAAFEVSKAYYADVNAREEARLRAQTTSAVARMRGRDEAAGLAEEGAKIEQVAVADQQSSIAPQGEILDRRLGLSILAYAQEGQYGTSRSRRMRQKHTRKGPKNRLPRSAHRTALPATMHVEHRAHATSGRRRKAGLPIFLPAVLPPACASTFLGAVSQSCSGSISNSPTPCRYAGSHVLFTTIWATGSAYWLRNFGEALQPGEAR